MPRSRNLTKIMLGIMVALLLAAGLIIPSGQADAQSCAAIHVVQPGENLFRIGLRYGVSWTVIQTVNGLTNPNHILVGRQLCIPGVGTGTITPPPPTPPYNYWPPAGIYPYITFNTRSAGVGDTLVIYGYRFPGGSTVDIFIAPRIPYGGTVYPSTASGSATVGADGTLTTNFTIPADVAGVPLRGGSFSILVRARTSGYYGFNWVVNPRP